jgi:hypothetical protein
VAGMKMCGSWVEKFLNWKGGDKVVNPDTDGIAKRAAFAVPDDPSRPDFRRRTARPTKCSRGCAAGAKCRGLSWGFNRLFAMPKFTLTRDFQLADNEREKQNFVFILIAGWKSLHATKELSAILSALKQLFLVPDKGRQMIH